MIVTKTTTLNILYLPFIPLLTYLSVPAEAIHILAILLGLDYLTGILKAFVLKGNIKSYRAISGLLSKASILILPLAIAFMAKGVELDFKIYLTAFLSALIIAETYSIIGNIYSIISKEEIEEYNAVAMIIKRLRNTIEKVLILNRDKL